MSSVSVGKLKEQFQGQTHPPLVDVRTPAEFEELHAENAINLPLDRLSAEALKTAIGSSSTDQNFLLLCRSGARAEKARLQLEKSGISGGVVVEGGTLAWSEGGLPVVRGKARVISLERQVRIAAGSLILLGVLLGYLVHPGGFGLCAFVGAGLVFAGLTDWCGMGLLLARAPWNGVAKH